jgi:hypothetical protein
VGGRNRQPDHRQTAGNGAGRKRWRRWRNWNERSATPDRLTLGELATAAGVPYAFAVEAQAEGLLRPDGGRGTRTKRYRRRLASWLVKLAGLRAEGHSWADLRAWARRRWQPGHEDERRAPAPVRDSQSLQRALRVCRAAPR